MQQVERFNKHQPTFINGICRHKHRPHTNWLAFKRLKWQGRERERKGRLTRRPGNREKPNQWKFPGFFQVSFFFALLHHGKSYENQLQVFVSSDRNCCSYYAPLQIQNCFNFVRFSISIRHRVTIVAVNCYYMIID